MRKYKLGWKVVRKLSNERLFSMTGVYFDANLEYKIGKTTSPKVGCGPLCLFKTRQQARRFKNSEPYGQYLRVYRCEYIPSEEDCVWDLVIKRKPFYPDTILANKVRLLHQA